MNDVIMATSTASFIISPKAIIIQLIISSSTSITTVREIYFTVVLCDT